MTSPRTRQPGRRAFTLVEAVAAMVILGVLGSVTSQLVFRAAQSYHEAATRAQLHAEVSSALDRIDKELRQVPLKTPYGSVAPNIVSVAPGSFVWQDASGQHALTLTGSTLALQDQPGGAAAVLAADVASFQVTAFDASGAAMTLPLTDAACDGIRRIAVTLTLSRAGMTETLRSKVFLRSTMQGAAP